MGSGDKLDSDVVTYGQIFSHDPSPYDPHVRKSRVYFDPASGWSSFKGSFLKISCQFSRGAAGA